jgi:hypothetical protein
MAGLPGSAGESGGIPQPETFSQNGRLFNMTPDTDMDPEKIRFAMGLPIQADRITAAWKEHPQILAAFGKAMETSGRLSVAQNAALFRLITNPLVTQDDVAGMGWLDFRDVAAGGQELTNGRGLCRELLDKIYPPLSAKR